MSNLRDRQVNTERLAAFRHKLTMFHRRPVSICSVMQFLLRKHARVQIKCRYSDRGALAGDYSAPNHISSGTSDVDQVIQVRNSNSNKDYPQC